MTFDDVKKVDIEQGKDTKIYDIITDKGDRYLVASRTVLGANTKLNKWEKRQVKILSINTILEGVL